MKVIKETNFLYTDGRDVAVTQSTLLTKRGSYHLKGITDLSLAVLKPQRLPGLLIMLMGLVIIANGFLNFISASFYNFFSIPTRLITPGYHFLLGIIITALGITYMLLTRKRYAMRIETAEGEKDAVVSDKKEYVKQIVNAVRKARSTKLGF